MKGIHDRTFRSSQRCNRPRSATIGTNENWWSKRRMNYQSILTTRKRIAEHSFRQTDQIRFWWTTFWNTRQSIVSFPDQERNKKRNRSERRKNFHCRLRTYGLEPREVNKSILHHQFDSNERKDYFHFIYIYILYIGHKGRSGL